VEESQNIANGTHPRQTVRWGIVGCGDVVRKRVADAIKHDPDSTLIAGCRRDLQKLNAFCQAYQVERGYTEASSLITADDIDAVYIATPVYLHAEQAIAALDAGKHVLVEKPMAMNAEQCQQMIAAAKRNDRRLGVAYYRRFYPAYQRMKDLFGQGQLGSLLGINIVTSAPIDMQPGEDGYWRVELDQGGGGPLMDVGSHRLDLLIDLLGQPNRVLAHHSRVDQTYESENVSSLLMEFSGGVQVTLKCLFGAAVDPDVWTMIGTAGVVHATPLNAGQLTIVRQGEQTQESLPPADNFNAPLIADFVAGIQAEHAPSVDGEAGLRVNQAISQAYRTK